MRYLALALSTLVPTGVFAATYDVGPSENLTEIGEVPWETLEAGDIVRIHHRDEPYHEKFVVGGSGTMAQPILVQGVPSATGALPVIDGEDATTRAEFETWNEDRAVVKIGGADVPAGPHEWIVIENLDIRGAYPGTTFTDHNGETLEYLDNAAALYVDDGDHITIRGCILRDSATGLFVSTASSNVLVEKNLLHGNGVEDLAIRHNLITEGSGVLVQYNRFGPLRDGSLGRAAYDASAGFAFRYNWVEGGALQIWMDPNEAHEGDPDYGSSYVYGNVFIELDDEDERVVFWDRPGTLHFFHNTVLSKRPTTTTLFDMDENREIEAANNIFYATAGGDRLALLANDGTLSVISSYLPDGYKQAHGTLTGTIHDGGGLVGGASPGFIDETTLALDPGSVCRDKATPMSGIPSEHAVAEQYADPRSSAVRTTDGAAADLGAFETTGAPPPPPDVGGDDVGDPPDDGADDDEVGDDSMTGEKSGGCLSWLPLSVTRAQGSHWPLALIFGVFALLVLRRRS